MTLSKAGSDKFRPLIKWTGGKYSEFKEFGSLIPSFERYLEPFFGGGGVFFALQTDKAACLNDKSRDLINFYKALGDNGFRDQAFVYADAWDQSGKLSKDLIALENRLFSEFISQSIDFKQLQDRLAKLFSQINHIHYAPLFELSFCMESVEFIKTLCRSLADKFRRIRIISQKEGRLFNQAELEDHFETGLKSGIYLYLRKLMNDVNRDKITMQPSKGIANWYFIREFCYASMFRFNAKGEFNIPYGGIAYNCKNFRAKIQRLFSTEVGRLFENSQITNLDFEDFLNSVQLTASDFIFLDPPYDSEFSEYDQNAFTQEDQVRLARCLEKTSAKWMMIIKETPFIKSLYEKPGIFLLDFDKKYSYNVRGRNNRNAKHLIILNYQPEIAP